MSVEKTPESELRKSESRYRLLLDTMEHGVQENDCEGTIIYSNRAQHRILGYEYGELIGKKIWEMVPAAAEQELLKEYLARLVTEQPPAVPYVTRNSRKDGSLVDVQIDWNYQRDATGAVTGFISVITDITDRKKIEAELHHRTQGLTALLEISRSLAASLDLQQVLQVSVDGVTRLIGLDTAAVYLLESGILHLWATTPPLPPQFPDALRIASLADHPHIQKATISKEPELVADMLNIQLSPSERSVVEQRNLRTVLFVPLIAENKVMGVFIVGSIAEPSLVSDAAIDLSRTLANLAALTVQNAQLYKESQKNTVQLQQMLTDRIEAEEERKKLQAQLMHTQKIESVGRLAGGVAHDFNNMLGVILGYTELALAKVDKQQTLHGDLMQVHNAARRSADLTRQLLAFARKQTVTPKILDLNTVIGDMLKMLRRLMGEDIDLVWSPAENLDCVKLDPGQVDQILANLCVNARDAIAGVGKVTIETSNVAFDEAYCAQHPGFLAGAYVMIAVSDNGVGMRKETLTNIFEPYFSTKRAGKGTGLGLSTVYGIVKQNNGFVNVYSEPGRGTTFKIFLARHEAEGKASQIEAGNQFVEGGSETILLVEDEEMILKLGRRMLESLGYSVLAANNPSAALTLAKEHAGTVDLLITDVVMPEMDGLELAGKLETLFPGLNVLFISGYTANVIAHHGVLREGVMLLPKPFSKDELAIKVRQAIFRDSVCKR